MNAHVKLWQAIAGFLLFGALVAVAAAWWGATGG
jgi:hypothetical protein